MSLVSSSAGSSEEVSGFDSLRSPLRGSPLESLTPLRYGSQADGVEEVGVAGEVEFFAFVAKELAVEPVDLLLELEDAFTLLLNDFLILGQLFTHAKK